MNEIQKAVKALNDGAKKDVVIRYLNENGIEGRLNVGYQITNQTIDDGMSQTCQWNPEWVTLSSVFENYDNFQSGFDLYDLNRKELMDLLQNGSIELEPIVRIF